MKKKIALFLALALCLVMIFSITVFAQAEANVPDLEANVPDTNTEGADNGSELQFKLDGASLGKTVPILATGMIGIFIVTGIIIAVVLILNTTMTAIDNKKQNKENK